MKQLKLVSYALGIVGVLLCILLVKRISSQGESKSENTDDEDVWAKNGRQSNARNYVFFDLGVNNGDTVLKFFNMNNAGNIGGDLTYGKFGAESESARWIVYGFEANPVFNGILTNITNKLSERHSVYMYKETAAWTYDGIIDFYVDTYHKNYHYIGSSLFKTHPDIVKSKLGGAHKITVDCKHISRIIKRYNVNDLIVVKMDIEGAEYDLLLDFFKHDVFKYIDYIAVEYHKYLSKFATPEDVFLSLFKLYNTTFIDWI